jgi:2-polyprenyl-6-methoxyphenol hydroxylase-like FAD-dependent oxidoreductase
MDTPLLIVGAGPTGLVMALWLAKSRGPGNEEKVGFRIVEKRGGPGEASRAMVVQARTLELYRQLGIAEEVIAQGIKADRLALREGDREIFSIAFGDFGKGISPYPFALSYPQDDHERFLVEALHKLGVEVEWNTELTEFQQHAGGVSVTLRKGDQTENWEAAYVCGCDGAHSTVRGGLGLGFPGGTYEQLFFVADVQGEGTAANRDVNLCVGKQTLHVLFPLRREGMYRLIGLVPPEVGEQEEITYEDVRPSVEKHIDLRVKKVNWFSKYRVHHRVTDRFGIGRVFIAGDAAHIHSPAGGQGMNTGIGDAVNLAWKLAAVGAGRANPALLQTYESERIGFAHSLVATTDRLFQALVGTGLAAEMFRTMLLPHIVPFMMGLTPLRKAQFRLVSQTRIHYPQSALSAGSAGDVSGGDRLPWVEEAANFEPLRSLQWQIHVYGEPARHVQRLAETRGLALHRFPWTTGCQEAGIAEGSSFLVRPDGYIAAAALGEETAAAERVLDRFEIT